MVDWLLVDAGWGRDRIVLEERLVKVGVHLWRVHQHVLLRGMEHLAIHIIHDSRLLVKRVWVVVHLIYVVEVRIARMFHILLSWNPYKWALNTVLNLTVG